MWTLSWSHEGQYSAVLRVGLRPKLSSSPSPDAADSLVVRSPNTPPTGFQCSASGSILGTENLERRGKLLYQLVRNIEDHGEEIWRRVLRHIQRNDQFKEIRRLPEVCLREWLLEVPLHLDEQATCGGDTALRNRSMAMGQTCLEEHVPLHEAVKTLHVLKHTILDFVLSEGMVQNCADLYAEEELRARVSRLFDSLVYHTVMGFERGLPETVSQPNPAKGLSLPHTSETGDDTASHTAAT